MSKANRMKAKDVKRLGKPRTKPTSARLLKNRPHEPEDKMPLLENPDEPKKEPRQKRLPTMEDPAIEELEALAESYAPIRDQRIALNKEEKTLKDKLLSTMKANGKQHYHRDGIDIEIVPENEKVRVKIKKDEDE